MFAKSDKVHRRVHASSAGIAACIFIILALWSTIFSAPGRSGPRAAEAATQRAPAAPAWEHQSPLPTGAKLEDIDMISATEGWAAGQEIGNGGVVVHTTDGGVTWSYSTTGVEEPNYAIKFLDSMHGWASSNNAVFYTTDGGNTWGEGKGVIGSMYFVEFATLNDGFTTSGIDHGYFRTTDGGVNWFLVRMPRNVAGIQFFDANNGVANSPDGVYHTTDRGNTWTFTAGQGGTNFINHNIGFKVTQNISQRTTDGGATWQSGTMPGGAWVYDAHFVDAQNGWATGPGLQVLRTTNGGMTWNFVRQPDTYPYLIYEGWGIDFGSSANGIMVGGFGGGLAAGAAIFSTSDTGATWTPRVNGSATTTNHIFALDANRAWAANDGSETLWTTDGGVRWNLASFPGGGSLQHIDFIDQNNGWVVGYTEFDGSIARTTDGGRTWTEQFLNLLDRPLYGVDMVTNQTIIAVGGGLGGRFSARSTDGGTTWNEFNANNGSIMFDVFFINQTTGWIVGLNGKISKSTDGGATWTAQNSPVVSQLNSVSFVDENNGWAVGGFSSTVLHTTNGGQTWVVQNAGLPTQAFVSGVSAVSPSVAWIATGGGDDPHVLRTTNGGATWVEEATGAHEYWNSWQTIHFVTPDYGWVGGTTSEPRGGIQRRVPEASTPTATGTPGPPTSTSLPTFTAVPTNTPAATCPPRVVTGSLAPGDSIATSVLDWNEIASTCAVPKSCPPTWDDVVALYDSYTYTNSANSTRCVTVILDGRQCGNDIEGAFSAAYLGSFNPNNACANYLADPGFYSDPFAEEATMSFNVPAGATFVIVVQEASPDYGCQGYTLTVAGLDECSTTPTVVVQPSSTVPTTGTPVVTIPPTSTRIATVATGTTVATATRVATGTAVSTGTRVSTQAATTTPTSVGTTPTLTSIPSSTTAGGCAITFSDVPATDTFYSSVRCLACRGIVSGYSDGTFRPNNQVTRGQLAKMVSNSAGFSDPASGQTFEDVPSTNTFYEWIERLTTRGYMTGYNCGGVGEPCTSGKPYFRPFSNATRGQTSKIVANAAQFTEPPSGQTFEDVPSTHTFYEFIQRLASRNVMSGYACGSPGEPCTSGKPYFRPSNDVTRGQSSKIVGNTFFSGCNP